MARPLFYRVRYSDGRYLGYGPPTVTSRGYPSLVQVHECEAQCFDTPRMAAELACDAAVYPFTVETDR